MNLPTLCPDCLAKLHEAIEAAPFGGFVICDHLPEYPGRCVFAIACCEGDRLKEFSVTGPHLLGFALALADQIKTGKTFIA